MITHVYKCGQHTFAKVALTGGGSVNCKLSEAWDFIMYGPPVSANTGAYCNHCTHRVDLICGAFGNSCSHALSERCFGREFKEVSHVD